MKLYSKSILTRRHPPLLGTLLVVLVGCTTVASGFKLADRQTDNWPDQVHDRANDVDEPMLVWSTKTKIIALPIRCIDAGQVDWKEARNLVEKDDYVIEMFDVSLKDRLALYGINSITAAPTAGGDNYLGSNTEQKLSIKFDPKAFAVDWVDHNVYAYYEKKLRVYSLKSLTTSALIYNGTQTLRNLVIEHQKHFIAWIGNENNIVKANKDGSSVATVHISKSKIECMSIDSISGRFFFFIMEKATQTGYRNAYDDYGGGGDNEDTNDYDNSYGDGSHKYAVLYSVDFRGENAVVNEMQVKMSKKGAIPVQMARYKTSTYMIREYEIAGGGKKVELGMPDRNNKFKPIMSQKNWQINNVQVAGIINVVKDICNKDHTCGWSNICVHMTDDQAKCIDSNGQVLQMTTATTKKGNTVSITQLQGLMFGTGKLLYSIVGVVLVPVCGGLGYFIYTYYFAKQKADEKSATQAGDGGEEGSQGGATGSKIQGLLKSGQQAVAADAAPKEQGWIKSAQVQGSEDEEQQQAEMTEKTGLEKTGKSQLAQKSNKPPSLVSAPSNAPKSQAGEMAAKAIASAGLKKDEPSEKRKLSVKRRQDRKNLYASLDKVLDTDQVDKGTKSVLPSLHDVPTTEPTSSSTPKSGTEIKKEFSFKKMKSQLAQKSNKPPSLVRAPSNAPKSQAGEMAAKAIASAGLKKDEPSEKRKLSVKRHQDRKNLYASLDKVLDTDQVDKGTKSVLPSLHDVPTTEPTSSSTPKSSTEIKKEFSFKKTKSRSASKTGRKSKTTPDEESNPVKSKSATGTKVAKRIKSKKPQSKIGSLVVAPICSSGSEHDSSAQGEKAERKASRAKAKSRAKSKASSINSQTGGSRKAKSDKTDASTSSKSASTGPLTKNTESSSLANKAMNGTNELESRKPRSDKPKPVESDKSDSDSSKSTSVPEPVRNELESRKPKTGLSDSKVKSSPKPTHKSKSRSPHTKSDRKKSTKLTDSDSSKSTSVPEPVANEFESRKPRSDKPKPVESDKSDSDSSKSTSVPEPVRNELESRKPKTGLSDSKVKSSPKPTHKSKSRSDHTKSERKKSAKPTDSDFSKSETVLESVANEFESRKPRSGQPNSVGSVSKAKSAPKPTHKSNSRSPHNTKSNDKKKSSTSASKETAQQVTNRSSSDSNDKDTAVHEQLIRPGSYHCKRKKNNK